jgi:hypothetical protein
MLNIMELLTDKNNYKKLKMTKKIAIILRGAISKINAAFREKGNLMNKEIEYVNFKACCLSIKKFIIDANPDFSFDFYIYSYNPDLEQELINLYKPIKTQFENNKIYENYFLTFGGEYNQVSYAYSVKKGIELMESTNIFYNRIIIYRPDLLLYKQMLLHEYDPEKIYANAHVGSGGDFHFVMNMQNAKKFMEIMQKCIFG